jgi:hypothetical protein
MENSGSVSFFILILVVAGVYFAYYFYQKYKEYKDNIIVLQNEAINSEEYVNYVDEIKECNDQNGILKLYIDENARKPSPLQPEVMMRYTYTEPYCMPKEIYKKQRILYNLNRDEFRHKKKDILVCNQHNKLYKHQSGFGIDAKFICE